jgi:carboxyl-terminal processing protease
LNRSLDPYTEFETAQDAIDLTESIDGKYAGVGLVITGSPAKPAGSKTMTTPTTTVGTPESNKLEGGDISSNAAGAVMDDENDEEENDFQRQQRLELNKARRNGIRVVNAFEGYAYDYGLRVGDKLVAIDGMPINEDTSVDQVRNGLRGEPGTQVSISFEREGVAGVQTVTMPRQLVRIDDVKLATLVGKPSDGIGYIQLTGFASDAGREVRQAILALQRASEDASGGEHSLRGLILDLRGNPGGLLTSAVDVASLLVPKGSDIVSARGRGFPGILYRSRVDPILDVNTKLAVLVNGNTASAAEIVSGAVQDLDVGIIVGGDRTFGKGLVQNVEELPFNSALKFTVAKYYTPSGRCIQGITYTEGGGKGEEDSRYVANKVAEKDKNTFYTRMGRAVRDGGGIEVDYKVEAPKASALEVTLLRSGLLADFAAEWSKKHELTNNFQIDDETYKNFQAFVTNKQRSGDVKLEALYGKPLSDLKSALKKSGYKGSEKMLENLQTSIIKDIQHDFDRYASDIKEDLSQSILARYLPESMLIERGIKSDKQVQAAIKLVSSPKQFDTLLARGSMKDKATSDMLASNLSPLDNTQRLSGKVKR